MALTTDETIAKTFLGSVNGEPYDETTNPDGMGDPGYLINFEKATFAIATYGNAIEREGGVSITAAATTIAARDTTLAARDVAVAAKDVAVAASVSTDYPFATTAGTSTAYTVDFTPNRTVEDSFSMRVNFHLACGATPTISVDGGTAYEIVDGLSLSDSGEYRSLDAGDIFTGMNLVLTYDSTVDKMVITAGFPIYKLSRDLDMNGFDAINTSNVVTNNEAKNFTAGYTASSFNAGTRSSGTFTPNPNNGNIQHCVNGGSFALIPPSNPTVISVEMINNATAGAVDTSAFSIDPTGDELTTVNGDIFILTIRRTNTISTLHIEAMQ